MICFLLLPDTESDKLSIYKGVGGGGVVLV